VGTRTTDELRGLLIADQRLTLENLAPNDGTALGSLYTEGDPRPGTSRPDDPRSELLPAVSHAQDRELELLVENAGDPGREFSSRVRLLYRDTAETTDFDWLGWNAPSWLHHWETIAFTTTLDHTAHDAVVLPWSQRVVVAWTASTSSISVSHNYRSTPDWTSGVVTLFGFSGPPCLIVLPSRRLVLYDDNGESQYSDDEGATWTDYSAPTGLGENPTGAESRSAVVVGELVALVEADAVTPTTWRQYVSRDLGMTFELVATIAGIGRDPSLVALPDGSIGVVYRGLITLQPTFRRIGSPFESIGGAAAVNIDSAFALGGAGACAEQDGTIWAFGSRTTTTPFGLYVWRSSDLGDTWEAFRFNPLEHGSSSGLLRADQRYACAASDGGIFLFHSHTAAVATTDLSLHVATLGGWAKAVNRGLVSAGSPPFAEPEARFGFGADRAALSPTTGNTWHAIELPNNMGWILTTTGGTATLQAPGVLALVTAAQRLRYHIVTGTDLEGAGQFDVVVVSGGLFTATHIGLRVRLSNGVVDHRLGFNFTTSGFRVIDIVSGGTLAQIEPNGAGNPFSSPFQIAWEISSDGAFYVLWRAGARAYNPWALAASGTLTASGAPIATGGVFWGAVAAASTGSAEWRMHSFRSGTLENATTLPALATSSALKTGRPFGVLPYPLGWIGGEGPPQRTAGELGTLLEVRGGPGGLAELHTLEPSHDHPIANLFAERSPSPSATYRSATRGIQRLSWSLAPTPTRIGSSWLLGVLILRSNFGRATVEVDTTGAGAWVAVGTWDARVGIALGGDRHGPHAQPATGTATASRFWHRNELAGGIVVDAGLTGYRIGGNTSGRWAEPGTVAPPVITAPGFPSGTVLGTTFNVQAPSGLLVVQLDGLPADFIHGIRVRLNAPSGPGTVIGLDGVAEDYTEAGLVRVGAIQVFGQQWSRGYSVEDRPNVLEAVSSFGTIRRTQLGPMARTWSLAWPDGLKLDAIRGNPAPDFLGPVGKPPAVTDQDVWTLLAGLFAEVKGGELPVVGVARVPAASGTTITDPTLFLHAVLDGSARFDHVLGDEGVNEFGRLAGIQLRELV